MQKKFRRRSNVGSIYMGAELEIGGVKTFGAAGRDPMTLSRRPSGMNPWTPQPIR